jgi:hypothetical protein
VIDDLVLYLSIINFAGYDIRKNARNDKEVPSDNWVLESSNES